MHDARETKDLSGAEKRALLECLLLEKASRVKSSHPLSHGQQALWFLHQNAPESPAYNAAAVFRILSPVDVSALRAVFETLVARHASLRSTFSHQDGRPMQIVHGHQTLYFEEIDASLDTEEEFHQRVTEVYRHPFDLEQGPLLRVGLFTRAPQDHVLLIAIHHIVTDGWSVWMLLSELLTLYPAQKSGQAMSLPPLPWQYQDFVRWQTELLASKEGERLWGYWQKQLSGELPVLELPMDHPRPPVQSYQGASVFFRLPEPLTRQLKEQAQASGATPYMILLATFQVLLHRYTGQDDILVGSPTTGRSRPEFEGICGYLVNPIVLRARLEGNPSFAVFLDQVRQTVLEGLAHQDYPFPLLVQRLQPARDTSHSPIFQVLFAVQKARKDDDLSALLGVGDEDFRVVRFRVIIYQRGAILCCKPERCYACWPRRQLRRARRKLRGGSATTVDRARSIPRILSRSITHREHSTAPECSHHTSDPAGMTGLARVSKQPGVGRNLQPEPPYRRQMAPTRRHGGCLAPSASAPDHPQRGPGSGGGGVARDAPAASG